MSKFNETQPSINEPDTLNKEGAPAFSMSTESELISAVLTTYLEDKFYESAKDASNRILSLAALINDKKFVAQLAVYARTVYNLRSISHLLTAYVAKSEDVVGQPWVRPFLRTVVVRPDDMAEIISLIGPKDLRSVAKRAFADVLESLNEYKISKYKMNGKKVNMKDIVRLCHPKHTDAIDKLIHETLAPAETWEVKLTQSGQVDIKDSEERASVVKKNKTESFRSLILEEKMGYMALMRNLRNILELLSNDNVVIDKVCSYLTNKKAIENNKQMPYRYYTAYNEVLESSSDRRVLTALEQAVTVACDNVPKFDGKTCIMIDTSGSMTWTTLSKNSVVYPYQVAALFAAIMFKENDSDIIQFDTYANLLKLNPNDSVFTIMKQIQSTGGGTNIHKAFELVSKKYDRIVIFSDCQTYDNNFSYGFSPTQNDCLKNMKKRTNSDPYIYSVDLMGYGTLQFPESKIALIAGFSDTIFDLMSVAETDKDALVNEIKKVEFK